MTYHLDDLFVISGLELKMLQVGMADDEDVERVLKNRIVINANRDFGNKGDYVERIRKVLDYKEEVKE